MVAVDDQGPVSGPTWVHQRPETGACLPQAGSEEGSRVRRGGMIRCDFHARYQQIAMMEEAAPPILSSSSNSFISSTSSASLPSHS